MSLEISTTIAERLTKAGITCKPYRRNPVRGSNFILNLDDRNMLRVWATDNAEVEIHTDKRNRQATVTAVEKDRKLSRDLKMKIHCRRREKPLDTLTDEESSTIQKRLRTLKPFFVNGRWTGRSVLLKEEENKLNRFLNNQLINPKHPSVMYVTADIKTRSTTTARGNTNHFLIGYDEKRQFICALRDKPDNPAHARELLRPAGVPANALRQGEFFFIPATQKEIREIRTNASIISTDCALEKESSHRASTVVLDNAKRRNARFALGQVFDERGKNRHSTLLLNGWHRVVRNNEIKNPVTPVARTYWD